MGSQRCRASTGHAAADPRRRRPPGGTGAPRSGPSHRRSPVCRDSPPCPPSDKVRRRHSRLLRPLMDEGHEKQSAAQQKHPRIDQRGGQSRQQNGKFGYRGCSHRQHRPAAAPQAMPLLSTVTMAPPGSAARKRPASPDRSTTAPNTSPSQQPMPQPYRAAPSAMGIRTSETENGPKRMALPTSRSTAAMAARSPPPAIHGVVFPI